MITVSDIRALSTVEVDALKRDHPFKALHAVYHERDFRVRVNDPTQEMVARALATCVGRRYRYGDPCPACGAGFDYNAVWESQRTIDLAEIRDGGEAAS